MTTPKKPAAKKPAKAPKVVVDPVVEAPPEGVSVHAPVTNVTPDTFSKLSKAQQ
jgi:hypothetical protein